MKTPRFSAVLGIFIALTAQLLAQDSAKDSAQDLLVEKAPESSAPPRESSKIAPPKPTLTTPPNEPLKDIFVPTIAPNTQIKDLLDAYDDPSGVLSLGDLLNAAKDSHTMQAKDIAIAEAEATRSSYIGKYLPSLDVAYSYTQTGYGLAARDVVNNPNMKTHALQGSVNWLIFDGGAREANLLANNALIRAAIADKGYSQEALFLQITSLYYQFFTLKGQILAMEQKKINIAANVARIELLYNAGLQSIDALEALRAELSATEYQLESLRLNFEQTRLNLSLSTNLSVEKLRLVGIKEPKNIAIQSQNITMQEEQATSLAHKVWTLSYFPNIALVDTYTWNFKSNIAQINPQRAALSPKHQNVFGVTVSWNLFSGFSTNRAREALSLSSLRLQKLIAYAKIEQKNNISLYLRALNAAKTQIESARSALKSATVSFESVSQKYSAALVGYNDYLNALTTRFNAEATFVAALNNYELQKANYIFYSGQGLLDYVGESGGGESSGESGESLRRESGESSRESTRN